MLKQNTPEWLEMRKKYVGASDAPVIMEESPYKTPYQLWEEKLGLSHQVQNSSMRRGHDLEDKARDELTKMTGIFFLPQVKFHKTLGWMMASLDAIDAEGKHIAEIKCPSKLEHEGAHQGVVPKKYMPQLQHQMEVCEVDMAIYFSFNGEAGAIVKVYRDDAYIKSMLEKEKQFFDCMQEFTPPQMISRDYQMLDSDEWWDLSDRWRMVNEKIKVLEKEEKDIRDLIIIRSQKRNTIGAGIKVTKMVKKGVVDYSQIPELEGVDLDKYRKDPMECYRISSIK